MEGLALIIIVLLFLIWIGAALWNVTGTGDAWDQIGRGGTSMIEHRSPEYDTDAERDEELRQMIEARNRRRVSRGLDAQDVDAELRGLKQAAGAAPAADPELEAEVRAHVEARNARRIRAGEQPLDVESEVQRHIRGA